jgi:hypothetical protein
MLTISGQDVPDRIQYRVQYNLCTSKQTRKQGTCYTTQTWPKTKTIKTKLESIHPPTNL